MLKELTSSEQEDYLSQIELFKHYKKSPFLSIKHSSYFQVYEELLSKYKNKKITFVEVGIFNGGSLFMWRSYFGEQARIIGIDLNPEAKKWEKEGFEIYIGSQSDHAFWELFFKNVGMIDVLLDDGGHTNEQQIISTYDCIPFINDNGVIIVEDTHTSYMKGFNNPTKFTFINYAKKIIDDINFRFPSIGRPHSNLNNYVYSINFYESIVCFNIDRRKCFLNSETSNNGITSNAVDYRYDDKISTLYSDYLSRIFNSIGLKFSSKKLFRYIEKFFVNNKIKKYFK